MSVDVRTIRDMNGLIAYFAQTLSWRIDLDDFEDIEDIAYDFEAEDIGLKEEAFAKIKSLRQLPPLVDGQKWGIFCVEFDSRKFEVTALRKILSGLIPKRRRSPDHAVWDQKDLLFLCFWGSDNDRTIGIAHFEETGSGLPQIKMISCAPAMEDFTQIRNFEDKLKSLKWPMNYVDHDKWREDWSSAFVTGYRQTIRDAATLTAQLAAEAQGIQKRILAILEVESANGYVHLLYDKFKNTLIHDMTETQFADMYAQTVVYGLFSARCMDDTQEDFSAAEAVDCIPNTNPFLKSLMRECLGSQSRSVLSFDELEIGNVVDLLKHTKTDAIIADFNRQTGGGKEDPVIHFYEEFLTAYDKAQKVQRGVYYTPQPVVNFIVRAVDTIIKKDFGLEDGLASTATKTIKVMRQSKRKVGDFYKQVEDTEEVPAIQVLDPATGTGTFIRQAILQIYENFKDKNKSLSPDALKKAWNEYVPVHLLPRINAFELMMAPYAVAHMKLAMVLKDTGYEFESDKRLNVYLTNSLEEPGDSSDQFSLWSDPLAVESIEANKVKKNSGICITIGNPPYAAASTNKGQWILGLMEDYKKEPGGKEKLKEKNPKWLNDDYVKFLRLCERYSSYNNQSIIGLICPHGFIDNPTFRGMRWHLLNTFNKIYILNLHGNSNRKEKCPDGSKDDNVFDIQQGTCIALFIKTTSSLGSLADVYYADLWGSREHKYNYLTNTRFAKEDFSKVCLVAPEYNYTPTNAGLRDEYNRGFAVDELFSAYSVGVVTAKDKILIAPTEQKLISQVESFYGIKADYSKVKPIYYRPLDKQYIYYDPALLERSRESIMRSFFYDNIGLITARSNKGDDCTQFLVTDVMSEAKCGERTTQSAVFPLYTYTSTFNTIEKRPNLNDELVRKIEASLKCEFSINPRSENQYSYEDLLAYVYGVLSIHAYRVKYKQFINSAFPKVPYPESRIFFERLSTYGHELINLHLMNSAFSESEANDPLIGKSIEKVSYKEGKVYIDDNTVLASVDEGVWNFTMCGYQPLQKWLKDRRGLRIEKHDIDRFRNMQICIEKTLQIYIDLNTDPVASSIIK